MALFVATTPSTARAGGVVGTGSAASCADDALNAALAGGGLVTFNCGGPATIDISSGTGTKTIAADTTIDGGGTVTISGGHSVGVFSVSTGVKFTVQNLAIANGKSTGDGGGISNNGGTVAITNSTFSSNSAGDGGGIANVGGSTLTVSNSTFSSNSASNAGAGGGIFNYGGRVTVTNGTFSGNSAGHGGGIFSGGTLTLTNSTLSGNSAGTGGGIFNDSGTVTVTNTIVANSTSDSNCSGLAVTDGGHNIDDGTTCGFTGTGCATTSGSSFCSTDPHLDPAGLADNGGPTQTIALQAGSPAVNAGNESVCAAPPVNNLDQRGGIRPGDGATSCSIGAYEWSALPTPSPKPTPEVPPSVTSTLTPVPTHTPTRTPAPCVGDCTGTHTVAINNLITLVNIALGTAHSSACAHGIPTGFKVNIALLIQAVNNALYGCGP